MCRYSGDLTGHIQTTPKISSMQAIEAKGSQQLGSLRDKGPGCRGMVVLLGLALCHAEMHPVEPLQWHF